MRRFLRIFGIAGLAATLSACGGGVGLNLPINPAISNASEQGNWDPDFAIGDNTIIGLSFSGGGMRAAAFAQGVLLGLDEKDVPGSGPRRRLTDSVDFIAGVSGGSIPAAWFGLRGREGLASFRSRFLLRNAEEGFDTEVSIGNVVRILTDGGVNDASKFPRWLDDNLFEGATFNDLFKRKKPIVWISASDIYNRVPFTFEPLTFSAICGDLGRTRISEAVAASAAVPGVFTPLNVENFGSSCGSRLPKWMQRSLADTNTSQMLRASAQALNRLRGDPQTFRYIKLLDGGLTDNLGVQPVSIMRANRDRAYAPLSAEQGARGRRLLFLAVDSGRGPAGNWTSQLASPGTFALASAVTDAAIDSGAYKGYDYFLAVMKEWERDLRNWRCSLSAAEVGKLRGTTAGWNCRDVDFYVGRVSFDDLGPSRGNLDNIETSFKLPAATIDQLVAGGRNALNNNQVFRTFMSARAQSQTAIARR
ncbi:patatin-like phospholipase family protein [Roseiarcaceae bacterium H3SJ34-1]|uniref:patatin-like phospholipase family protein n=1 Tax=Terripilifer ovatus TaxID=3032367 RepID=UPI003AB931FD|nr:patatin-like phospholipase family protein [Roseiarcaceae bacterium H3SJ34-1]